jgi:Flp pilus assembly CpaE family ATPase
MSQNAARSVLLLTSDDAFAERVMKTLVPKFEVVRGIPRVDNLETLLSASNSDLCLVDIDGPTWDQPADLASIGEVKALAPAIPIVIATADLSIAVLLSAMRLGVNDVCEKDFASDELLAQIEKHGGQRTKPVGDRVASLVAFVGAREGSGTTTTALAFSEIVASRVGDDSWVLLLDFSHPPAEIPDLVGARPSYFMTDAVHDIGRLDATMIESAFIRASPRNLFVLPLAGTERGINSLSLDELVKLMMVLRTYFHSVVADVNWCWRTQLAIRLFRAAAHRIVCTSQSVTAIHAVTAFLTQLREVDGGQTNYRLAITRHDPSLKPTAAEIQGALGCRLPPYLIAEDRKYVELVRNAGEMLTRGSRSSFVKSVQHLVDDLDRDSQSEPYKGGPLLARLHRRFGRLTLSHAGRR